MRVKEVLTPQRVPETNHSISGSMKATGIVGICVPTTMKLPIVFIDLDLFVGFRDEFVNRTESFRTVLDSPSFLSVFDSRSNGLNWCNLAVHKRAAPLWVPMVGVLRVMRQTELLGCQRNGHHYQHRKRQD